MQQQTLAQARVIDPILTTFAQGYVRPGNVGQLLFPRANVATYGGQILTFGKEAFRKYNTKRAPGSATKRVQFGYAGQKYAIAPSALEAVVPFELQTDASQVPGIDLASDSVGLVMDIHEIELESECAALATTAANYDANHKVTLTTTDCWTAASTSDPTSDVFAGSEAIRSSIGMRPNVCVLSPAAFAALQFNEKILDRLKYTSAGSVTTDLLARLWNIAQVAVADAVQASGQTDALGDLWGDDVVLAYVAPPTGSNARSNARPSYGYTYTLNGMPLVRQPYQDQNALSWVYGVSADRTPVLSGITAGFVIKGAGTPQ